MLMKQFIDKLILKKHEKKITGVLLYENSGFL